MLHALGPGTWQQDNYFRSPRPRKSWNPSISRNAFLRSRRDSNHLMRQSSDCLFENLLCEGLRSANSLRVYYLRELTVTQLVKQ